MYLKRTEEDPIFHYSFTVSGDKGTYNVRVDILSGSVKTHCNCTRRKPCWHIEYVLAGKRSRLVGGDLGLQGEMIRKAAENAASKDLLREAKKKYAQETRCRRCNSANITKIKGSVTARFFTLFRETTHHKYYCKDCQWTW